MPRLIDADALKKEAWPERYTGEGIIYVEDVDKAPTVDAVEVVHGEWEVIEDAYFDLVELKCSVCGESWGFEDYEDCIPQNYHYCPNGGAKMDGDGNA